MAEDKLDVATDKDVFASAMTEAPVEETVVEKTDDRPRDEQGKFIPKEAVEEKPKAEAPVEQVAEPKPKPDDQPPSWRLREEAEARRAAEQRAEAAERRAEEAQRELRRRLQAQPQEQPKSIDILEDPDGYARSVQENVERRMLSRYLDASFEDAKDQHGEAFDKAYGELLRMTDSGDTSTRDRIINAGNPGKALMRWYGEREAIREIGGDLKGYRQKVFDEAMKDPDFRKKAMEAWRDEAGNGNGQRPHVVTQLPSLNRAPGGSTLASDKEPETDAELFRSVGGGRRA